MTLTKAIEAAKRAFKCDGFRTTSNMIQYLLTDEEVNGVREALAALPDKPMSEEEIIHILNSAGVRDFKTAFHALKAANVLYVEK